MQFQSQHILKNQSIHQTKKNIYETHKISQFPNIIFKSKINQQLSHILKKKRKKSNQEQEEEEES